MLFPPPVPVGIGENRIKTKKQQQFALYKKPKINNSFELKGKSEQGFIFLDHFAASWRAEKL